MKKKEQKLIKKEFKKQKKQSKWTLKEKKILFQMHNQMKEGLVKKKIS